MARYAFPVRLLHPLLPAGLSRRTLRPLRGLSGVTAEYRYDGQGNRVEKLLSPKLNLNDLLPGPTTTYVYDAFRRLAAEYSMQLPSEPAGTLFRTTDHLGSTRLVTKEDPANPGFPIVHTRGCRDFFPFGERIDAGVGSRSDPCYGGTPGDFAFDQRFTEKERDDESGLDYFLARYYSAKLGRFTSPDWSEVPQAIPFADFSDPQTVNLYSYIRNNPLGTTDPDGHCPLIEGNQPCSLEEFVASVPDRVIGGLKAEANIAMGMFRITKDLPKFEPSNAEQAHVFDGVMEDAPLLENGIALAIPGPKGSKGKGPGKVHGNSKASTRPQILYELGSAKKDVVKTGISGVPLNANGTSNRVNRQVNLFNRQSPQDGPFTGTIVERNIPGRAAALAAEKAATTRLDAAGNSLNRQKRPKP